MRVPDFDEVLALMREGPAGVAAGAPASPKDVADAEGRLGVSLPKGYRSFLTTVGWAKLGSLVVYGVGEVVPEELELVTANATFDKAARPALVRIARESDTSTYCLDAAHEGPYESPVYQCANAEPVYVAHDFASWLWMRVVEETGAGE